MSDSALQTKIPALLAWIQTTVHRHRHVARTVTSLKFARLPRYFQLETLRRACVVVVDTVPKPPLTAMGLPQFEEFEHGDADGIAFGHMYFVKRVRAADEALHFHELVHVSQWQVLGPEQFILSYALELENGYRGNAFEKIAYALEDRFTRGDKCFGVEAEVKDHAIRTVERLSSKPLA